MPLSVRGLVERVLIICCVAGGALSSAWCRRSLFCSLVCAAVCCIRLSPVLCSLCDCQARSATTSSMGGPTRRTRRSSRPRLLVCLPVFCNRYCISTVALSALPVSLLSCCASLGHVFQPTRTSSSRSSPTATTPRSQPACSPADRNRCVCLFVFCCNRLCFWSCLPCVVVFMRVAHSVSLRFYDSELPLHAPSSADPRFCCWTRPPRLWTPKPNTSCSRPSTGLPVSLSVFVSLSHSLFHNRVCAV